MYLPALKKWITVKKDIFYYFFKVQDDLRVLREKMANGESGSINISDLDRALAKTEEGLQVHIYN